MFLNHFFETKTLPAFPLALSKHASLVWLSRGSSYLHSIFRPRALRYSKSIWIGNKCPGDDLMIYKYSYKRQTCAPHCALYSSPRQQTKLACRPPSLRESRVLSLRHLSGDLLSLVWACPRPEWFLIPYIHVMNNNTQGRILHYSINIPRRSA